MEKRGRWSFLLVFAILLVSQLVYADTLIETGWYRNGDSFIANSIVFKVLLSETKEKVLISFDSEIETISLGSCIVADDVKICLEDFTDRDDLRAKLSIYSVRPELKITRAFNATSFFIGEKVNVDVIITNEGNKSARNVVFEQMFPSGIRILKSDGEIVNETLTKWSGDLDKGEQKELSYRFIAEKELDSYDKATVISDSTTFYSKRQRLSSISCYGFSSAFNLTNVSVADNLKFNITLENKVNDTIDVNYVRAYFPSTVEVSKDLQKNNSFWQWSGTVGAKRKKVIESILMPTESFRLQFPIKVGVTCNDVFYEKEFTKDFDIKRPILMLRTTIDDINQTDLELQKLEFDSAQGQDIVVKVQKPDPDLVFKNADIKISTNLEFENSVQVISTHISSIETTNNIEIARTVLRIPDIDEKKIFYMNITANFTTQFGQNLVQNRNYQLTIKPVRNIRVMQELAQTTISEGEYNNVTVNVKNLREIDLKSIRFQDFLVYKNATSNISIKLNERTIDLEKDQERLVYTYSFLVPNVQKRTSMKIETKVDYFDSKNQYSFSKTKGFAAEPKKLDIFVEPKVRGDSFTGSSLNIEYNVENKDIEPAFNIVLFFPLQQDLDILGNETYTIKQLLPGERLVLKDIGKLRPKVAGKFTIKPFRVQYEDQDQNVFNLSSQSAKFDVLNALLIGPALVAAKNASKQKLMLGETFNVDTIIENKGNEPANVAVYDFSKTWQFSLMPGRKKTITLDYIADIAGKYEILPAKIKYSSLNQSYTTVSNSVVVSVYEAKQPGQKEEPALPPVFVFTKEKLKLNPLATLVLITLIILTSIVAYIYVKESMLYKKPLRYSEEQRKWIRY